MDTKSANRLRILGLFVLAIFFVFAFPVATALGPVEDPYKDALATTLAIGIGLLLLAEIAPLIKSLRAGGVEVQFGDSVSNKFNEFETRLHRLEQAVGRPQKTGKGPAAGKQRRPPALKRRRRRSNDPWKGRFGGESARDGYRLTAEFKNDGKSLVQVVLAVTAPPEAALRDLQKVDFYLHDTFEPDVVPAAFHARKAELSLLTTGGFTVGAWIPGPDVELELDLAELPGAPLIVRDY